VITKKNRRFAGGACAGRGEIADGRSASAGERNCRQAGRSMNSVDKRTIYGNQKALLEA
jgi:hypothetical protein